MPAVKSSNDNLIKHCWDEFIISLGTSILICGTSGEYVIEPELS